MRENLMVRLLMIAFGLGAILDFVLSIFGMVIILKSDSSIGYVTCVVTSLILLCLRLCAKTLTTRKSLLYQFIFLSLLLAIVLDCYAISNAVATHIIYKQPLGTSAVIVWKDLWENTETPVLVLSAAVVFFLTISPMTLSYLFHESLGEDDDETAEILEPVAATKKA